MWKTHTQSCCKSEILKKQLSFQTQTTTTQAQQNKIQMGKPTWETTLSAMRGVNKLWKSIFNRENFIQAWIQMLRLKSEDNKGINTEGHENYFRRFLILSRVTISKWKQETQENQAGLWKRDPLKQTKLNRNPSFENVGRLWMELATLGRLYEYVKRVSHTDLPFLPYSLHNEHL